MKKSLLFAFIIINSALAKAQVPSFNWAKSTGAGGAALTLDGSGNIYVLGSLFGSNIDMDPGPGTFTLTSNGSSDITLTKLDPSGNFIWAKQFGNTGVDAGTSLGCDASGNVCLTGYYSNTVDFDPGAGVFNLTSTSSNIFIVKIDGNGNFIWAKTLGAAAGYSSYYELTIDPTGNIITTGEFLLTNDFDPGSSTYTLSSVSGSRDAFISKLDASGNFVWAKQIGSAFSDNGRSITTDAAGNVYTSGWFGAPADFDPGAGSYSLTPYSTGNTYILKLDGNGNFIWARNVGLSGTDIGGSIKVDASNSVYTAGYFNAISDFDPGSGTYSLTPVSSNNDIFILKLDALGNFNWARSFGTNGLNLGLSMALDASNNVYTAGSFFGTADFDPGPGTYTFNAGTSGDDFFIEKLDNFGNLSWMARFGTQPSTDYSKSIYVDATGSVYTCGGFSYNNPACDFDPGPGTYTLSGGGGYVLKLGGTVGVKEFNLQQNDLNIFPNPSSGLFNLELNSPTLIVITNILGEEILSKQLESGLQSIDLKDQASGIYFVKIGSTTRKIIKE